MNFQFCHPVERAQSVVFQIWNWTRHERRIVSGSDVDETNAFVVSPSRISSPAHVRSDAFQVLPPSFFPPHALYNVSVCYCIQWHLHLNGPSGTSCLVDRELTYVLRRERGKTHPSALMFHQHSYTCLRYYDVIYLDVKQTEKNFCYSLAQRFL